MTPPGSRIQDGIYFRPKDPAGSCYRLVLLNIKDGTAPADAARAIGTVWAMLEELRAGIVADLKPAQTPEDIKRVRDPDLRCVLSYGSAFFDRYPNRPRPPGIRPLGEQPFDKLRRVDSDRRTGETDLALQLTANTNLGVDRALVDVWMLIQQKSLPLEIVTFHSGFNREDRRSWLGFHDGISNIDPSERVVALEVTQDGPAWMHGGTYMAFLRLVIDLETWRGLARADQESIVGRAKLTGCPIETIGPGPIPSPLQGCPVGANPLHSPKYINPPVPAQDLVRVSHIHRANPNRLGAADGANNRIFRQGYEFVEPVEDGHLRLGINFVSFQRSLLHLTNILTIPGWLGNANFGSSEGAKPGQPTYVTMASIIAGGFYAVPPKVPPFPGADLFG
jgi:deferrochelatase/peroxidase EfeB